MSGQLDEALAHFGAALRIEPDSVDSLYNQAELLLQTGRYEAAVANLNQAVQYNPTSGLYHSKLGIAHYLRNGHSDAKSAFERATILTPADEGAHTWLG